MTPEQYVQDKAAASGSSFYYAFLFLPPPRRAAITAFYAFCREVDDVVDETQDAGVAATKLAWWRKEAASAFAGQPNLLPPDYQVNHAGDEALRLHKQARKVADYIAGMTDRYAIREHRRLFMME